MGYPDCFTMGICFSKDDQGYRFLLSVKNRGNKTRKSGSMKLCWIKGKDDFDFLRDYVYMILGVRGSGKSSFLENLGIHYLSKGAVILDLFGSRDGEGLAWLRSPN